jgi:hypothetical protein
MKKCTRCKVEKDLSEFYNRSDKKSKDGKQSFCKACGLEKKRIWYSKHSSDPKARRMHGANEAKRRGLEFSIPLKEYSAILSKGCYYCAADIGRNKGVGLDRLDNSKGYVKDNVVSCCTACNLGRNNNFTPEEWTVMIKALKKYKANRE